LRLTTRKKRLTLGAALEQARAQIRGEKVAPKQSADEHGAESRDRERWITLPKHLSMYVGEEGVISQGYVWTHRVDRKAARTDASGVKRTPVRLVNLGPVDAPGPNYQRENKGPGQLHAKGAKTPQFVLGSEASSSNDHLSNNGRVLSPSGGRPRRMGMMTESRSWLMRAWGARR
jgi:hypothetical protein